MKAERQSSATQAPRDGGSAPKPRTTIRSREKKDSFSVSQAPKRAVNLSLDGALVDRARALTGNLSAQVETLLTAFVESREAENEVEASRLRSAARSWNEFDERHGSFADEFSTL